ncbi:hypothetical protein BpHYR1_053835 [Brachionus plicatilis]|uniref:Uncharacterized protein n=1 Tax=Brachionus plicatilis TaxID=10195 RepID=A0A3M7R4L0_BRAPC|nr:hypothetical protein BpHYR1_053835 [Brachionus plicatilis]
MLIYDFSSSFNLVKFMLILAVPVKHELKKVKLCFKVEFKNNYYFIFFRLTALEKMSLSITDLNQSLFQVSIATLEFRIFFVHIIIKKEISVRILTDNLSLYQNLPQN